MPIRLDGTNTTANPGITGGDADTGLQFGTDEVSIVTGGVERAKVDNVGRFDVNSGSSGVISAKQNTNNGGFNIYEGKDSTGGTKFYVTHNGRIGASEGVIFGTDTAAVNVLDDYEEGTWTPVFSSGGWTGFTTVYGARYTKIGQTVQVQLFGNSLQGTGNGGSLVIEGLPFLAPADNYTVGSVDFAQVIPTSPYCRKEGNNDKVGFYYTSGSTSTDRIPVKGNQIGSGYLIFSLTYSV